jgi:hypothetical protein
LTLTIAMLEAQGCIIIDIIDIGFSGGWTTGLNQFHHEKNPLPLA